MTVTRDTSEMTKLTGIMRDNMAVKVLVVDDEKLIVKGIRFSLEQDGMEVDCAYDGEEALAKAKEALGDKLQGEIRKEIYVPGRIINIVAK